MKTTLFIVSSVLVLFTALSTGCSTTTPVDSASKSATFRMGVYTSYVQGSVEKNFRATNIALDQLGFFRTEQMRTENRSRVYARAQGDDRITITLTPTTDGFSEISIKYGNFGDQMESQRIFLKIREVSQAL